MSRSDGGWPIAAGETQGRIVVRPCRNLVGDESQSYVFLLRAATPRRADWAVAIAAIKLCGFRPIGGGSTGAPSAEPIPRIELDDDG